MHELDIIEFSLRLKRAMSDMHYTAENLSDVTDIPVASIRNWTRGHNLPRLDLVVKMADALHVSIDWLCSMRA